jgi:hypothetical protein
MIETIIVSTWVAFGIYCAVGFLLLVPMHKVMLNSLDESMAGASIGFRIVVTPGLVLLWPVIVRRWIRSRRLNPKTAEIIQSRASENARLAHVWITRILAISIPIAFALALAGRTSYSPSAELPLSTSVHQDSGSPERNQVENGSQ